MTSTTLPLGVLQAAKEYFGWNILDQPPALEIGEIVMTPGAISAEMLHDGVLRSWIIRKGEKRCVIVERIESCRFRTTETYDVWEEYE